ncbi:MAG TPA: polysaccharide biosynthesis C-terminal domain-containing protein, partial [Planctomycetota bacterium]|nr:polysaccharide biosynthesis C-terminal domain-containing protein [Planctomycetota bacterium]
RFYGAAMLGVFNQVMMAYVLFSMAAAGGINYSLLGAVAEKPRDAAHVAGAVVGALLPTLLLAAVVTLIFDASRHALASALHSEGVAIGMRAAAPGLFFFALNKQLLAVVNGLRRMRAFAIYQALRYVLILAGFLIAWKRGLPGEELSFVWTFAEGILFVVLAVEVGTHVAWRAATGVKAWCRTHLIYGTKSVMSAMLLELNAKVDIWMLGLSLGDERVGVYSFAANLAEGFFQLIVVLQNNFNPLLANLIARGERAEVEALVRKARRWIVPSFAAAALASAVIYPWTLPLLKGPEFADSAVSFAILVGSIGALAAWLPFGNLLLMAKHPAWNSLLMLAVAGVNLAMNWVLIPRLEIAGAAVGTAIAFGTFAVLLVILSRRLVGVKL